MNFEWGIFVKVCNVEKGAACNRVVILSFNSTNVFAENWYKVDVWCEA